MMSCYELVSTLKKILVLLHCQKIETRISLLSRKKEINFPVTHIKGTCKSQVGIRNIHDGRGPTELHVANRQKIHL